MEELEGDTINTIYSEMYIYLDSTGELETIDQIDSFNLYNVYNIVPEYAGIYWTRHFCNQFSTKTDFNI